jgi:hypothetical protein
MQSQQTAEQRSGTGVGGLVRPDRRRGRVRWLAVLAGLLLLPLHVGAQGPGALDTSFGVEGIVRTHNLSARDLAFQSDGKIVVGGGFNSPSDLHSSLACYLPDGTLDETFSGGTVVSDFGNGNDDSISALVLRPGLDRGIGHFT